MHLFIQYNIPIIFLPFAQNRISLLGIVIFKICSMQTFLAYNLTHIYQICLPIISPCLMTWFRKSHKLLWFFFHFNNNNTFRGIFIIYLAHLTCLSLHLGHCNTREARVHKTKRGRKVENGTWFPWHFVCNLQGSKVKAKSFPWLIYRMCWSHISMCLFASVLTYQSLFLCIVKSQYIYYSSKIWERAVLLIKHYNQPQRIYTFCRKPIYLNLVWYCNFQLPAPLKNMLEKK